jgi:hypothetical protein
VKDPGVPAACSGGERDPARGVNKQKGNDMNAKRKVTVKKQGNPKELAVDQKSEETQAKAIARAALRPPVQAALSLIEYNKVFGELSLNDLVEQLDSQCHIANQGNLKRAEDILVTQAQTLDTIFNNLARRAARAEYVVQLEANLRLALKAQAQCRTTLEALAAIKNPQPVAFFQQANIAHGPQQVNNMPPIPVSAPPDTSISAEFKKPQTQLLGDKNG